jgi:uncharacterized membrane protein
MFKNTREMVLTSMLSAIIIIMSIVPQLGFINIFPAVGITLVHIPVLIGVMTLKRPSALVLGLIFGLGSLFAALTRASTPVELAFQNPLISVLPRFLFAWVSYELFQLSIWFQKKLNYKANLVVVFVVLGLAFGLLGNYLYEYQNIDLYISFLISASIFTLTILLVYFQTKKRRNLFYVSVSAMFSTMIHTVLVLGSLSIFSDVLLSLAFGEIIELIYGILITNGLLEALLALVVVTPIISALKIVMKNE